MQTVIIGAVGPQGSRGPQGLSGPLTPNNSGSFSITGSLIISGSNPLTIIGPSILSGSIQITQGITGSVFGTSSWATYSSESLTSLYALTASYALNGGGGGGGGGGVFIATGSVTASVFDSTSSFTVVSGSKLLFNLINNGDLYLTGSTNINKSGSTVLSVSGSLGPLLTVQDITSGSLFSVNPLSGIPAILIDSEYTISIGKQPTPFITVTTSSASVTGSFTGNLIGPILNSGSLTVQKSGSNIFSVEGSAGLLFNVKDGLTGSLLSINNVSGLPIFEVFSDGTIVGGPWNSNAFNLSDSKVGMGKSSPNSTLDVSGSLIITGSLSVTGDIIAPAFDISRITTGTTVARVSASADVFTVVNNSQSLFYVNQGGNVGIDRGYGFRYGTTQVSASTSTSSPLTIYSTTLTPSQSIYIYAYITGYNTASFETTAGDLRSTIAYSGSGIRKIGSDFKFINKNASLTDFYITSSGTTIQLQVVGDFAKTYKWGATVTTQLMN